MTPTHSIRRALMSGLVLAVVGCDVAKFALDPKPPRLVQTWNFPASSSTISVGSFLPTGVSIYSTPASTPPDSIGFAVTVSTVPITQVLGTATTGCTACVPLNGTNSNKPAFVLTANNATALPNNVLSAAVLTGQVVLVVTNNLTFDPLYVNTGGSPTQGNMIITIRSGSLVLGADTVLGAATNSFVGTKLVAGPFASLASLTRTIQMSTGTVNTNVTADIVFNSPVGDHAVLININKTIDATFAIPTFIVGNVRINVPLTSITPSAPSELPKDLPSFITNNAVSGALEMTITNPFTVAGNLAAQFKFGTATTDTVLKSFPLPASTGTTPQLRAIAFDSAAINHILKANPSTSLTISGGVSSSTPLTVTPKQQIIMSNRFILGVRIGTVN